MSEQNVKCPECGAENPSFAKFCMACGVKFPLSEAPASHEQALLTEQKETPETVSPEKASLTEHEDVAYDEKPILEGIPQGAPAAEFAAAMPKKAKPSYERVMSFVRGGICLLLSLLLFIFSFLPLMSFEIDMGDLTGSVLDDSVDLSFSAINNLTFFVDALYSYDEDDMEDSVLTDRFEEQQEELAEMLMDADEDKDGLTRREKRHIQNMIITATRLGLRSEEVGLPISAVAAAVVSLAYIVFALILLVLSLVRFISLFTGGRSHAVGTVKMLCFMPFFALFAHFVTKLSLAGIEMVAGDVTMGITSAVIILCAVGIALFIAERIVLSVCAHTFCLRRTIVNAVTAVLAIVTVCVMFAPVLRADVTATFRGRENEKTVAVSMDASAFLALDVSKEQMEDKLDAIGTSKRTKYEYLIVRAEALSSYTVAQIRKGEADIEVMELFGDTFVALVGNFAVLGAVAPYLLLLAALFMAIVAQKSLVNLCFDTKKRVGVMVAAAWSFFTACALGFIVAYVVCLNMRIDMLYYDGKPALEDMITAKVGVGGILFAVFGIASLISGLFHKKTAR